MNWKITVYDENNNPLDTWEIQNCSASEAFAEACADVPKVAGFFDWSLETA